MMKKYYGVENPYGVETLNRNGGRANILRTFETKKERDKWVKQNPKNREKVSSRLARILIRQHIAAGGNRGDEIPFYN